MRYATHKPATANKAGTPSAEPRRATRSVAAEHQHQPPQANQQSQRQRGNVTCRTIRPWLGVVDADPPKFFKKNPDP